MATECSFQGSKSKGLVSANPFISDDGDFEIVATYAGGKLGFMRTGDRFTMLSITRASKQV